MANFSTAPGPGRFRDKSCSISGHVSIRVKLFVFLVPALRPRQLRCRKEFFLSSKNRTASGSKNRLSNAAFFALCSYQFYLRCNRPHRFKRIPHEASANWKVFLQTLQLQNALITHLERHQHTLIVACLIDRKVYRVLIKRVISRQNVLAVYWFGIYQNVCCGAAGSVLH